jgi:hypothetical protein
LKEDWVAHLRAAGLEEVDSARQSIEDDHMNIICTGGRKSGKVAWLEPEMAGRKS